MGSAVHRAWELQANGGRLRLVRTRAGLLGVRQLYDQIVMASNISEMIVMIRHVLVIGSRTVLRTMLIATALADAAPAACACVVASMNCLRLVAAAAGVGVGVEWQVHPCDLSGW